MKSSKLFLLLCSAVLLFSCKQKEMTSNFVQVNQGYAIGTSYNIKYAVATDEIDYQKQIDSIFVKLNASISTYIPTSDISKVNKGDSILVVDDHFKKVFKTSMDVWNRTYGSFDPTVGALVNAWGFGPEKPLNELSQQQIDSILNFTGMDKVRLTQNGTIVKKHPNIYLDFNALGKGYAIDVIGELLDLKGVDNYLIEVGGEILAKGVKPGTGKPWVVGIDSPFQKEESLERDILKGVRLSNMAMATSGNYRKFRLDAETGEKYVHTINSKTGYTAKSNILSVSVLASNCMEADAFATGFMAMELEESKLVLDEKDELEALIMYLDTAGALQFYITKGFKKRLYDLN